MPRSRAFACATTRAAPICARIGFRSWPRSGAPDLRVRLKVLTWQELAALLPAALQQFLDAKYGIVAPGTTPSPFGESMEFAD